MKKFCLSFILLFSLFSYADLNGVWIGWANWSFDGSGTHCSTATFTFEEDQTTLVRKAGLLDCEYVGQEYPETNFIKKDGELWLANQKVGSYSSDKYSWIEVYSSHVTIQVSVARKDNALTYTEKWLNENSQTIYDISGRLFTK